MSAPLYGTVLATSLLGSLHCAAMCGPFVTVYSADADSRPWTAHAAYNLGRLVTYVVLGALAGAAGAVVDLAGRAAAMQRISAIAAALFLIAWGIMRLARAMGWSRDRADAGSDPRRLRSVLVRIRKRKPATRAAIWGLVTAGLPCGWLWAFVIAAAGTGSAWAGGALMLAFWLGTVPMLLGMGIVLRALAQRMGRRLPVVTAALLIVVGIAGLLTRVPMLRAEPTIAKPAPGEIVGEPSCH